MVSSLEYLCKVEVLINSIIRMRNDNFTHFSLIIEEQDKEALYIAAMKTNAICIDLMGCMTIVL